ncbi:undecaprenol kinase [Coriobacterium glomerans PW2]|uniref:Undecaprenol kinase n=1 Tax=Coriobacterium glomerans (strain ATCC 49209 / DSM 20642 / JCM 10262 / PW2) TaxID=700015 RepID=F2N7Q5_CORGP|nr:diacylglycerol kinase family protein [Coriobacterium glomerans]AEB06947.1 undecaprenol kinase [Coriobacterium glomerans PW2]
MIPGSDKDHLSFAKSLRYALMGVVTAVVTERNIKIQIAAAALAVALGLIVRLDYVCWALIAVSIGVVIFAELANTAMETIVDLATQEMDPLAKRAKDIAAASVLVLSLTAGVVGVLVFAHAFGVL